ncbi:MAG TPA: hypothetical protein VLF39_03750 [Candidatus Saccharimonadales bacterium]|nr:hypothetical protein [Candidatus Saccharimonadales bacterium]
MSKKDKKDKPKMTDAEYWISGGINLMYVALMALIVMSIVRYVFHLPI